MTVEKSADFPFLKIKKGEIRMFNIKASVCLYDL